MQQVIHEPILTEEDVYLFREGKHCCLYEKMGSHLVEREGIGGAQFAVWAPNAVRVSVIGDFNGWDRQSHSLGVRWDSSGIWEGFIPGVKKGALYKYAIETKEGKILEKGDPFALWWEVPPKTASVVWDFSPEWHDEDWRQMRPEKNRLNGPIAIYEMHYTSWRGRMSYRDMAEILPDYLAEMGFTHVEFLPLMEHPFQGSWGYQKVGYFACSSRFGTPEEFCLLIHALHLKGIGVILDWVPSHFPSDEHGLAFFDGTHLFEHADPKKGFHPDWKSYIFNYGRNEVRSFLLSSAHFWFDRYHIDGLRVDAVSSMLYLNYSRKDGEWIPNEFGGHENLEAIALIKELNESIFQKFPDVLMIAEESTAWPGVSQPTYLGGLGFSLKWNMGWMHDTLRYFSKDPIHRKYHHNEILFSMHYAFHENFLLPLSHDEVVHGKGSLFNKMPGDEWQRMANLRLLYGYQYTHPGKKLLFMGAELAQISEWNHDGTLEWHLLDCEKHLQLQHWLKTLNHFYRQHPALYEDDFTEKGFSWNHIHDYENSILSYVRRENSGKKLLIVCNFTPVPRQQYAMGLPEQGCYHLKLNSDDQHFGGSGYPVKEVIESAEFSLPPLSLLIYEDCVTPFL